jgi:lipopolysaccharide/colanic/teichoic acid biosynthesis glycosyltransferase
METNLDLIIEPEHFYAWQVRIDHVGANFKELISRELSTSYLISTHPSLPLLYEDLQQRSFLDLPDILLLEVCDDDECFSFIENVKKSPMLQGILILLLSGSDRPDWQKKAKELKVHDYYSFPFNIADLNEKIRFLLKLRIINPLANELTGQQSEELIYKTPFSKRLFDIAGSSIALILLSPLFMIIAILIRMESEGPVIYRSKRAGCGYKVFDFYKFRSMQIKADTQLQELSGLNQYKDTSDKSAFIKIVNDPRVTRVGKFLRNTSIDELPQLFNILIGDMSFVGNRPLPLYEAELLTSNEWAMRFLGPAGLTGLWQVSKRGRAEMSDRERKELDNDYARQHSFWLDLKIILKTFPALIQEEKV